jgi:hypothetical protein
MKSCGIGYSHPYSALLACTVASKWRDLEKVIVGWHTG